MQIDFSKLVILNKQIMQERQFCTVQRAYTRNQLNMYHDCDYVVTFFQQQFHNLKSAEHASLMKNGPCGGLKLSFIYQHHISNDK